MRITRADISTFFGCLIVISFPILFIVAIIYELTVASPNKAKQICDSYPSSEYVDGIYYHEYNHYTLFVPQTNNIMINRQIGDDLSVNTTVNFIKDVIPGHKNFVEYNKSFVNNKCSLDVKIHISDFNSMDGGRWSHGKFGSGQTVKLIP
jgi:hypothetical protein